MEPVLKQRLIGAIVLVALAVIFLPMLVKGPAPDSGVADVSLDVPEAPGSSFVEIPLTVPEAGAVGMPASALAPANAEVLPEPEASAKFPPTTAAGTHAVNFGAYASQADAQRVVAALVQAQLPGYSVAVTVNGKPAWRVRIGNYADRAEAEIARLEATKLNPQANAQVIVLDASTSAVPTGQEQAAAAAKPESAPPPPVTAPKPTQPAPAVPSPAAAVVKPVAAKPELVSTAPTAGGFAVQLGAFAAAGDANALRDRARSAGLSAFVEPVNTERGRLHRVRIGPVASRQQADALKAQVKSKLGADGMVVPHP